MEMSAKQPLCQSNYDAYEICVWGTLWRPPLPPLPAICAIPHPGRVAAAFFPPFALFYDLSHVLNKLLSHSL